MRHTEKTLARDFHRQWRNRTKRRRFTAKSARLVWLRAWKALTGQWICRLFVWSMAFQPFPQVWGLFALIVTADALRASLWLRQRGPTEALLALYGADNRQILQPTAEALRRRTINCFMDGVVILGLWAALGQISWPVAVLGTVTYGFTAVLGPRLLVTVLPRAVHGILTAFVVIATFLACAQILREQSAAQWAQALTFLGEVGSPSGWLVVLLRQANDGHPFAWALGALLIGTLAFGCKLAKVQDRALVDAIGAETNTPAAECGPAHEAPVRQELSADSWGEAQQCLPKVLPGAGPRAGLAVTKLVGTLGILGVIAGLTRSEVFGVGGGFLFLAGLAVAYALWLPMLGNPPWFSPVHLPPGREAALLSMYPLPLGRVLARQVSADLKAFALILPGVTVIAALLVGLAFPISPLEAASFAIAFSVMAIFLLPLRWYHLCELPQVSKPFFAERWRYRLFAIGLVAVLFLQMMATVTTALLVSQGTTSPVDDALGLLLVPVVLGAINGALAGTGIWLALSEHQRLRSDLISAAKGDME